MKNGMTTEARLKATKSVAQDIGARHITVYEDDVESIGVTILGNQPIDAAMTEAIEAATRDGVEAAKRRANRRNSNKKKKR